MHVPIVKRLDVATSVSHAFLNFDLHDSIRFSESRSIERAWLSEKGTYTFAVCSIKVADPYLILSLEGGALAWVGP